MLDVSSTTLGESSRSGAAAAAAAAAAVGGSSFANSSPDLPPDSSRLADKQPAKDDRSGSPPAKKQKFSRSRTACLQCRSRKSKCGALPPDPCPNCIEADLPCQWPTEDGRSSKARLQRYRSAQVAAMGTRADVEIKPDIDAPSVPPTSVPSVHGLTGVPPHDMLGEGWLDRLLAGGGGGSPGFSGAAAAAAAAAVGGSLTTARTPFSQFPNPLATPQPDRFAFSPTGVAAGAQLNSAILQPQAHNNPPFFQQFGNQTSVDPAQFVWAVSSRLPIVEESSPNDERSTTSDPSPANMDPVQRSARRAAREAKAKGEEGKTVKVSWWRPHGQTAIAPGLKKITLKVRVDTPHDTWQKSSPQVTVPGVGDMPQELITADGRPSVIIMRHLLDMFMTHFGCQFPFIDRTDLEAKIDAGTGSVFLLLSIAAIAARFSTHPAIALPDLQPYEYGNVFYARAKQLLGSMLGIPSRETVAAFVLLAHMGFAGDSECEVWMMTGLAVRMAIDCGLHMTPPEDSHMSVEDRRLNRLVFWSVLLMDYALSFGVGRQTAFRPDDITQTLPTEDDLNANAGSTPTAVDTPRSPFLYATKMMLSYGPLINMLNRGKGGDRDVNAARAAAIREYNRLPPDMQWNVGNLQRHSRNNQGAIFLHLHLWMHTIIASGYLTGTDLLRRSKATDKPAKPGLRSGAVTPNTATSNSLWRNSARTIGDILVLSDIINPHAYFALPFVNQAFFVAGCCYVKEIEQHALPQSLPASRMGSRAGSRVGSRASSPTHGAGNGAVHLPSHAPAGLSMTSLHPNGSSSKGKGAVSGGDHDSSMADDDDDGSGGTDDHTASDDDHTRNRLTSEGSAAEDPAPRAAGGVDLSRALLTSVATTNISTLQQGLAKLAKYWYGAEWIAGTLRQRIEGIHDVDLVSVRENFASFVSLPDAGVVPGAERGDDGEVDAETPMQPGGAGVGGGLGIDGHTPFVPGMDMNDLDFLSLPFDLGVEGGVVETEVPISNVFPGNWVR